MIYKETKWYAADSAIKTAMNVNGMIDVESQFYCHVYNVCCLKQQHIYCSVPFTVDQVLKRCSQIS